MFLTIKLCTHAKLNCLKCLKMDLVLNNLQRLICYKTQTANNHVVIIYCVSYQFTVKGLRIC